MADAEPNRLQLIYNERRESLSQEWLESMRVGMVVPANGHGARSPAAHRAILFESWVVGKLAELQALEQDRRDLERAASAAQAKRGEL